MGFPIWNLEKSYDNLQKNDLSSTNGALVRCENHQKSHRVSFPGRFDDKGSWASNGSLADFPVDVMM